jgi:TRAP-type C4-dicarboxylate transport system permease small subunit
MANLKTFSERIVSAGQIIGTITRIVSWIAYIAIAAMLVFVFSDVILRYFGYPTSGSNDIVQLLSIIAVALTMGYTQVLKRHPSTSFLVEKLSNRTQTIIATVTSFLSLITFVLLSWSSALLARHMWNHHEGTMTLGIPLHPLILCISLGSVLMCLVIALDFIILVHKVVKG